MKKLICLILISLLSFSLFASLPILNRNKLIEFSSDRSISGNPIVFIVDKDNARVTVSCGSVDPNSTSLQLLMNRSDGNIISYFINNEDGQLVISGSSYQQFIDSIRINSNLALIIRDNINIYAKATIELDVSLFNSLLSSSSEGSYTIGDRGPAGGIVFYDKGSYSDGWRYLEVSPADVRIVSGSPSCDSMDMWYDFGEEEYTFGQYAKELDGWPLFTNGTTSFKDTNCTSRKVGMGLSNTKKLVSCMGTKAIYFDSAKTMTTPNYAAKMCLDLVFNGFDDWYLPSLDELVLVYENVFKLGLCDYSNGYYDGYWSSSEYPTSGQIAYTYDNDDGESFLLRPYKHHVRAVRYF